MASNRAPLKVAFLIVSTSAAKDPSTDSSDRTLRDVFDEDGGGRWDFAKSKIVSDSIAQIRRQIMLWTDVPDPVHLIVTTGGTGFAESDQTPEAVSALLHKEAPGLVYGMLAASLAITPFAMMSRPVAGVRHRTVVVTLPGSPKGARENLQAIVKTLPHACEQAAGADSRSLHAGGVEKLETEAGMKGAQGAQVSATPSDGHHHHRHGHGHDYRHVHSHGAQHGHGSLVRHTESPKSIDPSLGPSRRHRVSPYPMVSVEEALELIKQHTPLASEKITCRVDSALVGSVLAEDVRSHVNVPAFRASIVDGYAVVVPKDGNMNGVFPVVSVSHAAPGGAKPLQEGEIARITTGAPLPPGATSVIMVEDTILKSRTEDGKEEQEVEILADNVKEGENIREVGSDIERGALILEKGQHISSVGGEIGVLAAVGAAKVQVYRRSVIGVLSTGDELVYHNRAEDLRLGEVRDTNRPTLLSAVRGWGFEAQDLGIASDKPGRLEETLRDGLRKVDVVITTGGVSMGELDLLKPTIELSLGGTIHFGRVAMKPGKPATFATVAVKNSAGERVPKTIFSLPGNPASALVTFHTLVLPSLHQMSGVYPSGLPRVMVTLSHDYSLDKLRVEYHRAVVTASKDATLTATSTGSQRSSKVGSVQGANAILRLPPGSAPLTKGHKVEALLMGPVRSEP